MAGKVNPRLTNMTKPQTAQSLEEQFKLLQKHFGAVIMTVKELKVSVDALEKKMEEIFKTKKVLDEVICENKMEINRLDKELRRMHERNKASEEQNNDNRNRNKVKEDTSDKIVRKCRYFNRGFCKYRTKCKYTHPKETCKEYSENQRCKTKDCPFRHQKECKWSKKDEGCKRGSDCEYLHGTLAEQEYYKCESCKDVWTNVDCVKEHTLNGRKCYFCLNCDEWIMDKRKVLEEGWTLVDESGYLVKC